MEVQKSTNKSSTELKKIEGNLKILNIEVMDIKSMILLKEFEFKNMNRHLNKDTNENILNEFYNNYLNNPDNIIQNLQENENGIPEYNGIQLPKEQQKRMGEIGVYEMKLSRREREVENMEREKFNEEVSLGMYENGI